MGKASLKTMLNGIERYCVDKAMKQAGGEVGPAAKLLGIPASTLHMKLRAWKNREAARGKEEA